MAEEIEFQPVTLEDVEAFIEKSLWREAKTMKAIPHCYTRIKETHDRQLYRNVCKYMRDNSVTEYFYKRPFEYFYHGDYKYWIMDKDLRDTEIINRCLKGNTYGN